MFTTSTNNIRFMYRKKEISMNHYLMCMEIRVGEERLVVTGCHWSWHQLFFSSMHWEINQLCSVEKNFHQSKIIDESLINHFWWWMSLVGRRRNEEAVLVHLEKNILKISDFHQWSFSRRVYLLMTRCCRKQQEGEKANALFLKISFR